MISGDELKYRKGLAGLRGLGIDLPYPTGSDFQSGAFALTASTGGRDAGEIENILQRAAATAKTSSCGIASDQRLALKKLIERIDLYDDHIDVAVRMSELAPDLDALHLISFPVERLRRGQSIKLVFPGPEPDATNYDNRLIGLIAEAHAARKTVLEQTGSLVQIAERLGKCRGNLADMIRISYLAPILLLPLWRGGNLQDSSAERSWS